MPCLSYLWVFPNLVLTGRNPNFHLPAMEKVITLMKQPAPKHVMEGLNQRLKEIETHENQNNGAALADECRKYIYSQNEILWSHVLTIAYYINGGVMLREARIAIPSSNEQTGIAATECDMCEKKSTENKTNEKHSSEKCNNNDADVASSQQQNSKSTKTPKKILDLHVPEVLEMEEMIRSMNVA